MTASAVRVVGVDLSLASTGLAVVEAGARGRVGRVQTKPAGQDIRAGRHYSRARRTISDSCTMPGAPSASVTW